jgi:HD-like signal output (HDOD) protein
MSTAELQWAPPTEQLHRQALASLGKLPPFSAVMNKLMTTLADNDVSFGEVANVIEQDAVLAGNVLKVVNSAAYGRRATVNSLRHAVSMLGLTKVRNTAMSISVGQMWGRLDLHPQWSPKQFHLNATATATMADLLALECLVNYPEGAFTAGLLSGVGLLLIATALRNEFTQLNRSYMVANEKSGASLEACERAILGFSHQYLSASVMDVWSLPAPIIDAVRQSGTGIVEKPAQLGQLLEAACIASAQLGYPVQSWIRPAVGDAAATLTQAGLADKADAILASFDTQMKAMQPFAA